MNRWLSLPLIVRVGLLCTVGFALLCAFPARADLVIRNNETGASLRLMNTPCTGEAREAIVPEWRDKFQAFELRSGGEVALGCWIDDGETMALVFEDGALASVKKSALKVDPGV